MIIAVPGTPFDHIPEALTLVLVLSPNAEAADPVFAVSVEECGIYSSDANAC